MKNIQLVAAQFGLGTRVSRQKTVLTPTDTKLASTAIAFANDFLSFHNGGFLSKAQEARLEDFLLGHALRNAPIQLVSIFCPSYKKGANKIGYNDHIGSTTEANVTTIKSLYQVCAKYGIRFSCTIFFSDLLLENYARLQAIDYRSQLENNFRSLQEALAFEYAHVEKLSTLDNLGEDIGEEGPKTPLSGVEILPREYDIILNRNDITYKSIYNWTDSMVRKRTDDLTIAYPYLARAVNEAFPGALFFWSETALERIHLMPNLEAPIFIPRKPD